MGTEDKKGEEATIGIRVWVDKSIEVSEKEARQFLNGIQSSMDSFTSDGHVHAEFRDSGELVGVDLIIGDELERLDDIDNYRRMLEKEFGIDIPDKDVIISSESLREDVETYESISICEDPKVPYPDYRPLVEVDGSEITLEEAKNVETPFKEEHILATSMNSAEGTIKTYDPRLE